MIKNISITAAVPILVFSLFLPVAGAAKEYVIGDQKTPVEMPEDAPVAAYVGADKCEPCHQTVYDGWKTTGHAHKLRTPDEILAVQPDLPFPDGYSMDEILYVIGGWGWKARYMDTQGFIITKTGEDRDIDGQNQYNVANGQWVDYNPGKVKKYDCTKCHNTGSYYDSSQYNLSGIEGSWEFRSVQCEACHGPGSEHVAQGGGRSMAIIVNKEASMCGLCHRRGGDDDLIPASGNFVQHHEQYLDFLSSGKMSELNCVDCHDPHAPVHVGATNAEEGKGIIKTCEECHAQIDTDYQGTVMQLENVTCVNCHMPRASRSAVTVSEYEGDIRSHLFRMNLSEDAEFIYTNQTDNKQYAHPYLTLEYICLPCHTDKDKGWASENAPDAMTLRAATEVAGGTSGPPVPGFGLITGTVVVLVIYLLILKKRL